jgi:SAM-dependent methyltransferase
MKYRQYRRLQEYVHHGYRWQRAVLLSEWQEQAKVSALIGGPNCLELACGGGNLAGIFPPERYVGFDLMPERIAAAAEALPHHTFVAGDVTRPEFEATLAGIDFVFFHGLLHHLNDAACGELLTRLKHNLAKPARVVCIEPLRPDPWKNPPGYLLCRADDGRFVRKSEAYKAFMDGQLLHSERHNFLPRWPATMEAFVVRYG